MSATATDSTSVAGPPAIPHREVRTRRVSFDFSGDAVPHYFMADDLVSSHVMANLSAVFPEGEDFFVRSVRAYRDRITDPELRKQVSGFIGQEAMHSREHARFNERLDELGFDVKRIDRWNRVGLRWTSRLLPKSVCVGVTAAMEHYTATLAELVLSDPDVRAMLPDSDVRTLWLWHAIEESEHKAVAFDVFQTVSGSYWLRAATMFFASLALVGGVASDTIISVLKDPVARRDRRRLRQSMRESAQSPLLAKKLRQRINDYYRRDFHPDDYDASALLDRWRAELFDDATSGRGPAKERRQ